MMSQVGKLVARIPVPRAKEDERRPDSNVGARQTSPPVSNELGAGDGFDPGLSQPPTEPFEVRPAPLPASSVLYVSDDDIAASPLDTKIAMAWALMQASDDSALGPDEQSAARRQLTTLVKSLKTPDEFDRFAHSVDLSVLMRTASQGSKLRARLFDNLRATTPGDWAAYSRHLDFVTGTRATSGNRIELLTEGPEMFRRLQDDLVAAKQSIDISIYKWEPDEVGQALAQLVAAKANPTDPTQPKVHVRVMVDRQGSFDRDPEGTRKMLNFMKANGVEVVVNDTGLMRDRLDHRKLIVIDEAVGYTGGMNFAVEYRDSWRDQFSRLEGPLVTQLRASMRERWREEGGTSSEADLRLPKLEPQPGPAESRVVRHVGRFTDTYIKAAYLKAIYTAQNTINIANPYFTDEDVMRALLDASKRGVKVRVMLPNINDVRMLRDAARASYPKLINGGIEVYEYQGRMAHQKVAAIDGKWSTFGSSNLDARSLGYNEELNVVSLDEAVANDINSMFENDLKQAKRISSHEPRLRERLLKVFSGLM